jgi:hypothetical protein
MEWSTASPGNPDSCSTLERSATAINGHNRIIGHEHGRRKAPRDRASWDLRQLYDDPEFARE